MKWFRRNIRTGSRLALFALALQFVLSFGHFHGGTAQATAHAIQALTDPGHAEDLATGAVSERPQPSNHHDERPSHEPCAICVVTAMANQMLFATPVSLPLPDAIELRFRAARAEFGLLGVPRPAFQSRAPPVS